MIHTDYEGGDIAENKYILQETLSRKIFTINEYI